MNRFAWIVTVPIALLVILFALMNRQEVVLSLWPLPYEKPLPLFFLTLLSVVIGFFIGALATWLSGGTTRQKLRAANRALAESRDELAILKRQHITKDTPAKDVAAGQKLPPHRPPAALPPAA